MLLIISLKSQATEIDKPHLGVSALGTFAVAQFIDLNDPLAEAALAGTAMWLAGFGLEMAQGSVNNDDIWSNTLGSVLGGLLHVTINFDELELF